MSPSKTSLDTLAAKASKLNAKTDDLNAVFEALEARLADANVGVTVWLDDLLDPESTESNGSFDDAWMNGTDEGWAVGYSKVGGKWRLAARQERRSYSVARGSSEKSYGDNAIADAPVPLVNAPRSVRASAAGLLDLLIEELTAQVDDYLENIEKATATASVKK